MARAEGFYTSEGKSWKRAPVDGRIPADWWAQLRNVDPAANRATFRRPGFAFVSTDPGDKVKSFEDDITVIGVELERAAVEARFPVAIASAPASALRHVDGKDAEQAEEPATPQATPQATSSTRLHAKENEIAIELAAQALREDSAFAKKALFEHVMASRQWATEWTFNRFEEKVWPRARERAGLPPTKGGRPKT